ncbi:MAG: hypothetical protein LBM59_07680 [Ruminococcus sp.]|jgi:hypothetical protein|nr:hypothetical protein [Ruminococcus sp.]
MKKDDLIKKARDRGIAIDETQADKYITLSDDELENLAVAGGCGEDGKRVAPNEAKTCAYFVRRADSTDSDPVKCNYCLHCYTKERTVRGLEYSYCYCQSKEAYPD